MLERDLIVGIVAIGLGLVLFVNAWIKREEPSRLGTMRMVEETFGRLGARIFWAILGLVLTAMGVFLISKVFSDRVTMNDLPKQGTSNASIG